MILRALLLLHLLLTMLACRAFGQEPPASTSQLVYLPNIGLGRGNYPTATFEGGLVCDSYPVFVRRVPPQWAHRLRRVTLDWELGTPTQLGDWRTEIENTANVPLVIPPGGQQTYIWGTTLYWLTWAPTAACWLTPITPGVVFRSGLQRGTFGLLPSLASSDGLNWAGQDFYHWSSGYCNTLSFYIVDVTQPRALRRFTHATDEYVLALYMSPRLNAYLYGLPSDAQVRTRNEAISRWGTAVYITYHYQ